MESAEKLRIRALAYKATPQALQSIRDIPLVFLVGISGAGKDTVMHKLIASHPNTYEFMISYTTRQPRSNNGVMEQNGVDYYFIDTKTAKHMLDQGEYLETNFYADNIYGTSIAEVARVGRSGRTIIR